MQAEINAKVKYAGFFTRLAAYLIDRIIIGIISFFVVSLPNFIVTFGNEKAFTAKKILFCFTVLDIVLYVLKAAYFVILTYFFEATPGKKLLKIKVQKTDETKLSFTDVLYRETVGRYISAILLYTGYIAVFLNRKHQGFHDMLCDTVVVYDFEEKNYIQEDFYNKNSSYIEEPGGRVNLYKDRNNENVPENSYSDLKSPTMKFERQDFGKENKENGK